MVRDIFFEFENATVLFLFMNFKMFWFFKGIYGCFSCILEALKTVKENGAIKRKIIALKSDVEEQGRYAFLLLSCFAEIVPE